MPEVTEVKDTQTAPAQEAAQSAPAAPPPVKKRPAGKGRRKIIKRLIALGVTAAILGGGGFALYRFLNSDTEELGEIFPTTASIGSIQSKVSGQGTARAKESAAITLTQSGVVQEVYVTGGQTVMAGDPLYTIYSQAAEDAVQAARENVTEAQKAVTSAERAVVVAERAVPAAQERLEEMKKELVKLNEKLVKLKEEQNNPGEDSAGGKELSRLNEDLVRLNEDLAKLNRELAELNDSRADLTVRAPHAGKIIKHESFTVGRDASPGAAVCTIADNQNLKLLLHYSYAYEDSVYIGQKAQVSIPSLMTIQEGRVEQINKVNFISPEGGTFFEVVVALSNPGALTEKMTATATMTGSDGAVIYPYADDELYYGETWDLELKIGGPVLSMNLSDHTLVSEGQALLTVGDKELKEKIEAKQNEIKDKQTEIKDKQEEIRDRTEALQKENENQAEARQEAIEAQQEAIEAKEKEIKAQEEEVIPDAREGIIVAQEAVEAAKQGVVEAQQKVEEAQKALADFNAVAPIDGTVTSCNLTAGQEVKSGDTVIMISNNVTMLVTITVDDRNISFIKPGGMVELKDWNDNMFMGEVTSIDMAGAEIGQGMTNYPVTLTVDNWDGSLMEGVTLQYSFVTSESEACVMVPTACVQYFSDMDGNRCSVVFVQREERPDDVPELQLPSVEEQGGKRRFPSEEEGYYPVIVETGLSDSQNVEILSGVEDGDTVFLNYTVTGYAW